MNETLKLVERKGVRLFLITVAGDFAPILASNLIDPISDEDLAQKCGMRAADARMVLNKMHNIGIIDYNRSKDKESGWYYYAWFLRADKLMEAYLGKRKNDLEDIEERLENNEAYTLYMCKKCDLTYDFDNAAELLYHCPICENILDRSITEDDFKKMRKISISIRSEIEDMNRDFKNVMYKKHVSTKVL